MEVPVCPHSLWTSAPHGLVLLPGIFAACSVSWQRGLEHEIKFPQARPIVLPGVNIPEPRDVAFFGDAGVSELAYGHLCRQPQTMTPTLSQIRAKLQSLDFTNFLGSVTTHPLNCVLVNYYKSGRDSMGLHSDLEIGLGSDAFIVSLSLGADRWFTFQNKLTKEKHPVWLPDGSVIIMAGRELQETWKHGLPKDKKVHLARWNLSFRYHCSQTLHNQVTAFRAR
jgi:alkylated DNA repair dioxygenase AlkB